MINDPYLKIKNHTNKRRVFFVGQPFIESPNNELALKIQTLKVEEYQKKILNILRFFKSKGYKTALFGKWHLGWDWDAIRKPGIKAKDPKASSYDWTKPFPGGPLDHGFDYYFGDGTINFPPYCWIENDHFLTKPTKPDRPIR